MSKFDYIYRRLLLTKFFTKGWGKPENLKRLFEFRKTISNRETCQHLVAKDYPVHIDKDEIFADCRIMEGHFISPFTQYLPGIMPKEVEVAKFQVILPKHWAHETIHPICLHLAGTGDHYFWRRRTLMARPLIKEAGIASVILENPYYGVRKPKAQLRSSLHNVSDLFVMGGALILESQVLLHWCERNGWGPLGITGISMGGHMASLAATNWPKPISLIPCLSWSTASCVFTQGVLSGAIPWEVLQSQYLSDSVYQDEILKLLHSPEDNNKSMQSHEAYEMGQLFAKKLDDLQNFQLKYSVPKNENDDHHNVTLSDNIVRKSSVSDPNIKGTSGLSANIQVDETVSKQSSCSTFEQTVISLPNIDTCLENLSFTGYTSANSKVVKNQPNQTSGSTCIAEQKNQIKLVDSIVVDAANRTADCIQSRCDLHLDAKSNIGHVSSIPNKNSCCLRKAENSSSSQMVSCTTSVDYRVDQVFIEASARDITNGVSMVEKSTSVISKESDEQLRDFSKQMLLQNEVKASLVQDLEKSRYHSEGAIETEPLENTVQLTASLDTGGLSSKHIVTKEHSAVLDQVQVETAETSEREYNVRPLLLRLTHTLQQAMKLGHFSSASKAQQQDVMKSAATRTSKAQTSRRHKSAEALQEEATNFMRGVMDECTHLGNFSVPVDTRLIIIIAAKQDAYVPRSDVMRLDELWLGAEVRYIDNGHIAAFLLHQNVFRQAIIDAFDQQIKLYYNPAGISVLQHQGDQKGD